MSCHIWRRLVLAISAGVFLAAPAMAQDKYPFQNPDLPTEQRIDNILSLMTIGLAAPDQGGPNTLNLVFSGGGVIQLEIEGTSVFLQDFGEAWPTQWRPEHDKVPAK